MLFEERPVDERAESMLAVLFSSILGYSKTRQSFLQARDFTPHLSTLIYNQRLVLLERTLPVRANLKLSIEARPRSNQLQTWGRRKGKERHCRPSRGVCQDSKQASMSLRFQNSGKTAVGSLQ